MSTYPHLFKTQTGQNSPSSCTFDNKFSFIVVKQGYDNEYFDPCVFFSISSQFLHPHPTHHLKLFVLKLLVWNISHMSIYVVVNLFDFRILVWSFFFFLRFWQLYTQYISYFIPFFPSIIIMYVFFCFHCTFIQNNLWPCLMLISRQIKCDW